MQIYKAHKKQTVTRRRRYPQQNKCVFSNRRNYRKVCSESRIDGEVGCSIDAVQQWWMSDRPELCEFLELSHTWRRWAMK